MIDYQSIIDIISEMMSLAVPLGFIFGISEWILNTFFGMVFGKRRVRGDY